MSSVRPKGATKITETQSLRRPLLREDVVQIATAAADIADQPGDLGQRLFGMFGNFDDEDLKKFINIPTREGISLMIRLGISPSKARDVWIRTWQAAHAVAYPFESNA